MTKQQRYDAVIQYFEQAMPLAETELHFANNFQLLVAVMLSAQCTDKRVNMVTPALFDAYPTPEAMSAATEEEVLAYVKSVSYPNSKARHLVETAQQLTEHFGGEVPDTLEELTSLPGVGRKTANVVMSVAFGQARMAVDTHVFRVSHRLGLVSEKAKTPLAVELELVKYIPEAIIPRAHHWLILHGRYVCKALKPDCMACGLKEACGFYGKNKNKKS
ncbi:MAG: endonuclease III [Bacteroidaceae bacterium]|nr:endonuclease III [Bacteroidaceae bacterium]